MFNLLSSRIFERRSSAYASLYPRYNNIYFRVLGIFKSVRNNALKVYLLIILFLFFLVSCPQLSIQLFRSNGAYCLLMLLFSHYFRTTTNEPYNLFTAAIFILLPNREKNKARCEIMCCEFNYLLICVHVQTPDLLKPKTILFIVFYS